MNAIVVLCTVPDTATGGRIADALVSERLAACVNRLPGIASTYRWKGAIQHDTECLLVIKTTRERFEPLRDRIAALHPYEVPEIIALAVEAGAAAYLDWVEAAMRIDGPGSVV
jgi:periplasmic divalent cation tolerance protein